MSEKHVFRLMLGDWSGDGHGIDTTYRIQSNKPIEEVRAAYFSALEQTGLDLTEEVCAEYEDNVITEEMVSRLKGLGLPVPADREWVQTDEFVDDNTLTVNVSHLRQTLGSIGARDFVQTRRGLGYLVL